MSLSGYSLALIDDGRNQPKTPQINSNFGFWWERKTRMPKGKRTYNIESISKPGPGHAGGGQVLSSIDTLQNQITS